VYCSENNPHPQVRSQATWAATFRNVSRLGSQLAVSRNRSPTGYNSSKLFQLRPVNRFYKREYDGSHLLQYGLIAEEVAKVYPEMVSYHQDGQVFTVKY